MLKHLFYRIVELAATLCSNREHAPAQEKPLKITPFGTPMYCLCSASEFNGVEYLSSMPTLDSDPPDRRLLSACPTVEVVRGMARSWRPYR